MREQTGITLVALVITVIVLIILAGITLDTTIGDNGIITKAQEAKQNMANAAAEEDKLIQNLLNELKGIEAGEGEIEVPDPPTEPEEPTYPTIESTLSEGKYVWYLDAYETQQKCIVLYGPENSNYSSYGIQIITAGTVTNDFTLGSNDFNTCRTYYNNAIAIMHEEAEKYRKKDDGIAEVARCVGSMPDNPNYDGAGMHTTQFGGSYSGTLKDSDTNYKADYNQMNTLEIYNINERYWFASRLVIADPSRSDFCLRSYDSSGILGGSTMCTVFEDGLADGYNQFNGLRLVFRLKSGIKVTGGDGREGNPYTLAP